MFLTSFNLASAQCGGCSNNGNIISSGSTYTATSAQAYYWEICAGNATIPSGTNTNQSVTVSCTGSYTIKVTRFVDGQCIETCVDANCLGACPSDDCLTVSSPNNHLQVCELGRIQFSTNCLAAYGISASDVQLSLYIPVYGESEHFPQGQLEGTWNLPDEYLNTTYLVGVATITSGGHFVCEIEKRIELECWTGGPIIIDGDWRNNSKQREINLEDSKNKNVDAIVNGNQISFDLGVDQQIKNVKVFNMTGQLMNTSLNQSDRSLTLNRRNNGVYKAIIETDKGVYYSTFVLVQ